MGILRQFGQSISSNRQKNHQFDNDSRVSMVTLKKAGQSYGEIAATFHTTKSTVHQIVKRFENSGNFTPKPRSGAPKKLSDADIRYLNIQVKKDRSVPLYDLQKRISDYGVSVCARTIARAMKETWGHKWRRKKRILLTKKSASKRLRFAREWLPKVEELMSVWPTKFDPP
jgi:transposase